MEEHILEHLNYLAVEEGVSNHTIRAYRGDLYEYARFLAARGRKTVEEVTERDILEYLVFLRRYLSARTTARKLSAIKTFHKFLVKEGVTKNHPTADLAGPKLPKKIPGTLTVDEVAPLMEAPPADSPLGLRDRAILELLYGSGLRVSELVSLDVGFEEAGKGFVRVLGKRSKERLVPIGTAAQRALETYLARGRPSIDKGRSRALFLSRTGGRLGRQRGWSIVKTWAERQGLTGVHPHTLRHSYASHLIQAGADLRAVQELLGHETVATTEIYTAIGREDLRAIYLESHPRGPLKRGRGEGK